MGPIPVEVVAQPPATDRQAHALIASCADAAGPAGCELAGDDPQVDGAVRAVVTFVDGYARVRVEARLPVSQPDGKRASRVAAREAAFQDSDPIDERFRAAGLIVAGLVADLAAPQTVSSRVAPASRANPPPADGTLASAPPAADRGALEPAPAFVAAGPPANGSLAEGPRTPPESAAPTAPSERWPVALSLGGIATPLSDRPRIGAALEADFPLASSPVFFTTHASYAQTVRADTAGISTFGGTTGAGVGVSVRIPRSPIWVRGRGRLQIEALRVAVDQPGTGQRDAESVLLPGFGADGELVWAMSPAIGAFAGVHVDWADEEVAVSVAGRPTELLTPWSGSVGFGATVWLP